MNQKEGNFHKQFSQIFEGSDPPIRQLVEGFRCVLNRQLADSQREMEVLRALGDKQGLVKEQIKHSTLEHALDQFNQCYFRAAGEPWDRKEDQDV